MSVRMMNAVFERYPFGGNEGMLAVALADHAHDDGTHIWPSLDKLAIKAKMSRSTVQRLLRVMVTRGWLERVRQATGRPGDTNEYRIAQAWIDGGELRPISGETGVNLTTLSDADPGPEKAPESVDNVIHTGVTHDERGVKNSERGVTAMTPESSKPSRTNTPLSPRCHGGHVDKSSKPEQPKQPAQRPQRALAERAGSGTAVTSAAAAERPPWRWTERRCDVEKHGERMGLGRWDMEAFNRGEGEPWTAYLGRVTAADARQREAAGNTNTKGSQC